MRDGMRKRRRRSRESDVKRERERERIRERITIRERERERERERRGEDRERREEERERREEERERVNAFRFTHPMPILLMPLVNHESGALMCIPSSLIDSYATRMSRDCFCTLSAALTW